MAGGDLVGNRAGVCSASPSSPVTVWKGMPQRSKAQAISGTQQAWQLASHSPVPVAPYTSWAVGCRFRTSTGRPTRWTAGTTWLLVA